jgi:hypothetical protein
MGIFFGTWKDSPLLIKRRQIVGDQYTDTTWNVCIIGSAPGLKLSPGAARLSAAKLHERGYELHYMRWEFWLLRGRWRPCL